MFDYAFHQLRKIAGEGKRDYTSETHRHFVRVCTDSRLLESPAQSLFFAMKGPNFDGHDFLGEVYRKGVRQFVVEDSADLPNDCDVLRAESSMKVLQSLARFHRCRFHIPIVGITGSNGKTMVKEWLNTLLSVRFKSVKSPQSYNSQLGVPLSLLELSSGTEIGVFEAGISRENEMKRLQKMIDPSIGIFTNLGDAHDAGFRSRQEKGEEKAKLFANTETLVYRIDNRQVHEVLSKFNRERLLTWTTRGNRQADISFEIKNRQCRFQYRGEKFLMALPVAGHPDIENLLHGIVVALHLGLDEKEIQQGLDRIRPLPMRLSLKKGIRNCHILDDTYNNDVSGLRAALAILRQQNFNKKKTVILTDLEQIGLAPEKLYPAIDELLRNNGIARLIAIGKELTRHQGLFSVNTTAYETTEKLLENLPDFQNELILLKGARRFELERVVARLESRRHGTVLTIRFGSLLENLNMYRRLLKPETKIMVMVKALAYGTGSAETAGFLQYHKVDYLGVAYFDEGVNLRKTGIQLPVMVMNPSEDQLPDFENHNLEPEIYSLSLLRKYLSLRCKPPVHLKIESGMNRLGFEAKDIPALLSILRQHRELKVASVFTHFSSAEAEKDDAFTRRQAKVFEDIYAKITEALAYAPVKHALNSAGIVRWPAYHFDMVRLGIGLHGVDYSGRLNLSPAARLDTTISQVKTVRKGEFIGYNKAGRANDDKTIAILPIGYADGYLRAFGNGVGRVLINNKQVPTVGNICMDMTMVDITRMEAAEGDVATIFGEKPKLTELAEWSRTIPHEVLTNIGTRVKRVYSWH